MRDVLQMLALSWVVLGCAGNGGDAAVPPLAEPPRPGGEAIRPPADLQARLDALPEGAALCLEPGVYQGPIVIRRPAVLWGAPGAVVRSAGHGSTVDVLPEARGSAVLGITVDGSGGRFDLTDAAVRVRADGTRVEGVTVRGALFGILAEKCSEVTIRGNRVLGTAAKAIGMRGDGIRLWEVRRSAVEQNHVTDSRDLVVWYSSDNRLVGNVVERGRYGTHFMYSHDNAVERNRFLSNVVGIFVMYSRGIEMRGNVLARSDGPGGLGLGLKESGDLAITGNLFVRDTVGIHIDNSPLYRDDHNTFDRNVLRFCDTAVVFHGIAVRSTFTRNQLADNLAQVRLDGGDDTANVTWRRNHFDDYRGYDLDDDGIGDVPYELRHLSAELIGKYPDLAFFRGAPASTLIDVSSHVLPLLAPRTLLVDPEPVVSTAILEDRHAR